MVFENLLELEPFFQVFGPSLKKKKKKKKTPFDLDAALEGGSSSKPAAAEEEKAETKQDPFKGIRRG